MLEKINLTNISELFQYVGKNYPDKNAKVKNNAESWQLFFKAWAGEDPYHRVKVFTRRDESNQIQGCVVVVITPNLLFVTDPDIKRLVNITNGDRAFEEYINTVLEGV